MRPREQLEGVTLPGGWKVTRKLTKGGTGGNFSIGYTVEHEDGRKGFLKAMDYHEALLSADAPKMFKLFTDMYLFEKQVCEACRDHHLSRIVHAIDSGSLIDRDYPANRVEYLVFELAEGGD